MLGVVLPAPMGEKGNMLGGVPAPMGERRGGIPVHTGEGTMVAILPGCT